MFGNGENLSHLSTVLKKDWTKHRSCLNFLFDYENIDHSLSFDHSVRIGFLMVLVFAEENNKQ